MKQMRSMMKNVMVVVSKTKGFHFEVSSIFSSSFCPNILFQTSLSADFLFFMLSRKRRIKDCFHCVLALWRVSQSLPGFFWWK